MEAELGLDALALRLGVVAEPLPIIDDCMTLEEVEDRLDEVAASKDGDLVRRGEDEDGLRGRVSEPENTIR